jgi:hypothetical protein
VKTFCCDGCLPFFMTSYGFMRKELYSMVL